MRARTTIVLFVLTGLALGFVAFFERRQPGTKEAAERDGVLLDLSEEAIGKIEITNAAGRVKLERVGGSDWQLTAPVKDRADGAAVKRLLQLASATEVLERMRGEEVLKKSRLKELGLDASQQARVTFYPKTGDAVGVVVGRPAPAPGSLYVQVESGGKLADEVLVVRVPWTDALLARSPGEWRDPRLLWAQAESIYRVRIQGGGTDIELQRSLLGETDRRKQLVAAWQLVRPLADRADQELVSDSLLPGLLNARALSFAEPGGPANPTGPAAVTVTVWSEGGAADGEVLEVFPGAEPESAWVQVAGRPGQARVAGDLLALRACTLDRMRDPKLSAIDMRRLTTVVVKDAAAGETPIYLHENTWYLAHEGLVHEANRDRVQSVVDLFNSALILQWFDQPEALSEYGLDNPFLEITFGTAPHADRSRPSAPTPEDSSTLRIGQRQNRFYAQWSGRPSVLQFDGSILGSVPREWIRFKSPRLLGFAPLSLRKLTLTQDPSPPLELVFDHDAGATWSATRQGTEVTEFLDRQQLERLVNRLSEFEAHDWSSDPRPGLEALQQPAVVVDLVIEQFDEGSGDPKPVEIRLSLAPTTPGQRTALYYGRLNSDPQVFVVRRPLVEELSLPILKPKPESAIK